MKPAAFDYVRPTSLEQALDLLQRPDARPLAGGQSLGPLLNLRIAHADLLVDISKLAELRGIEQDGGVLRVGAAVRHVDFEDGAVPPVLGGALQRIAQSIAYRAVRNRGTIGGSLAHADPAADWPPVLMALGAKLHLRSASGRRTLAAAELIGGALQTTLQSGELIEAIEIPTRDVRLGHCKICRKPGDFAESVACIALMNSNARTVIAGHGQIPTVLDGVGEAAKSNDEARLRQAAADEVGKLPMLSAYHRQLHQTAVLRAVRELWS